MGDFIRQQQGPPLARSMMDRSYSRLSYCYNTHYIIHRANGLFYSTIPIPSLPTTDVHQHKCANAHNSLRETLAVVSMLLPQCKATTRTSPSLPRLAPCQHPDQEISRCICQHAASCTPWKWVYPGVKSPRWPSLTPRVSLWWCMGRPSCMALRRRELGWYTPHRCKGG